MSHQKSKRTSRSSKPSRQAFALVCAGATLLCSAQTIADGAPAFSPTATQELTIGTPLTISGGAGQAPAGTPLSLQADPNPHLGFQPVAHTTSGPDGSYAFPAVTLDENTNVRVVEEDSTAQSLQQITVTVDPQVKLSSRSLGPGRTRLSVHLRHTTHAGGSAVRAWWYLAQRGSRDFHLTTVTPAQEISPGLTYASAIVDPPSKRFQYRVCLNPEWEAAMGPPAAHGACPDHDFRLPPSAR